MTELRLAGPVSDTLTDVSDGAVYSLPIATRCKYDTMSEMDRDNSKIIKLNPLVTPEGIVNSVFRKYSYFWNSWLPNIFLNKRH